MAAALNSKRGTLKRTVTLFANLLNTIQDGIGEEEGREPTRAQYRKVSDKCSHLQTLGLKFEEIQMQIEELDVDDNLADQNDAERNSWDELYYNALQLGEEFLARFAGVLDLGDGGVENVVDGRVHQIHRAQAQPVQNFGGIKMPVIELKMFSGNLLEWLEFRDMYVSMIHNNVALEAANKYHYLKSSLVEEAKGVIESLEITTDNYPIAWQALLDRYNNQSRLVNSHLSAIFSLKKLDSENSIKIRRLGDDVTKHLRALKALGVETDQWDPIVLFMITEQLDESTVREWETYKVEKVESLNTMREFLRHRANILEQLESKHGYKGDGKVVKRSQTSKSFSAVNNEVCAVCQRNHRVYACAEFSKLLVPERIAKVKRLKLCHNCLSGGHFVKNCRSAHTSKCRKCNSQHNSLLHIERDIARPTGNNGDQGSAQDGSAVAGASINNLCFNDQRNYILLATALVNVVDENNRLHVLRVLLDSCSQSSFLTEECCRKLKIKVKPFNMNISSLTNVIHRVTKACDITIRSRHNSFSSKVSCLVVPQISDRLPSVQIETEKLDIPANIGLADPEFYQPGEIDMLLGASHFFSILCQGQIELGTNRPVLQKTKLGWIISGVMTAPLESSSKCYFLSSAQSNDENLGELMQKFWVNEEIGEEGVKSFDTNVCEIHFRENTHRDPDGHFVVSFPFKENPSVLGDSRGAALKRFLKLESRLQSQPFMKELYCEFVREYEFLGHMCWLGDHDDGGGYYMPHHGVYDAERQTTKLKVVFDASAVTTTKHSLNSIQHKGPVIQEELFFILLRFRQHKVVIAADVQKMYRQIRINLSERKYQKIFWRSDPQLPLTTYQLNTVTYGTTAASFLAIRVLFELAKEVEKDDSHTANVIRKDFYVDDLLSGSSSADEAYLLCKGVEEALARGGLKLHKWISNEASVINQLLNKSSEESLNLSYDSSSKTLGLIWAHQADVLRYNTNKLVGDDESVTKRFALSLISRIFDPLGLLAPVIIVAKMLMQQLWLEGVSWDESLSLALSTSFKKFQNDLINVSKIEILRRAIVTGRNHLHIFSDASERAYGVCVYVVSKDVEICLSRLLCAKGRVAPLKSLTIPKLELLGALLASRLMKKVVAASCIEFGTVTFWSDSTVVLGWLGIDPNSLKVFVSNRVQEIQTTTQGLEWRHISSGDNPADLVSRGCSVKELSTSKLWWNGPEWLIDSPSSWLRSCVQKEILSELRKQKVISQLVLEKDECIRYRDYSSFPKLVLVVGYCLRFVNNCKVSKDKRIVDNLKSEEQRQARLVLARIIQKESFPSNLQTVQKDHAKLAPFFHSDGLVRVRGRLQNASLKFDTKHPILIDSKHYLAKLIFKDYHERYFYAGPQALLFYVRQSFWCLGGRNLARKLVRECVTCIRNRPVIKFPIMGNLPYDRVNPSKPFSHSGVDYAGPFLLRDRKGRGYKTNKAYICIFVCFAVKAIHIELVSDLTSQSFILALRRFASRRGCPSNLFSDNGLNFVGANKELKELYKFLIANESELSTEASKFNIEWSFIPAYAPHMGGLWEASVKSVKHHLKRVAADALLTYEEMYSLLVQIEAIVNSRPLYPMSADPNDFIPLTPAHFLIGEPLVVVADPDVTDIAMNRLSRFQLVQSIQQKFWRRWRREYLGELQCRVKWRKLLPNLKVNDLVLIVDENRSSLHWSLGRVSEVHQGADGQVRVASVKTSVGVIKRAVAKLCPLLSEKDLNASASD